MAEPDNKNDSLIRKIVETVYREMGDNADPETVKKIVLKTIEEIDNKNDNHETAYSTPPKVTLSTSRIIITAFGQNRPGMVAAISDTLAKNRCNIEDISQKILQDIFALVLIVDIKDCPISLRELKDALGEIGNSLGIRIMTQHEDVFNYMHRL